MVPDTAVVRFNVRVLETGQVEIVEHDINEIVRISNEIEGITAQLYGYFSSPPKMVDAATQQIQKNIETAAGELGIGVKWTQTGGACDGNKLYAAGLPNIDTLGVVGGNIHSSDEYVDLDSLTERAKLVALMLMKYASGEFELP